VHLAIPKQTAFLRDDQKASASVLVSLHPGRSLDQAQVAGIVNLVAFSVPQLNRKNVSVIDQEGKLISQQRDPVARCRTGCGADQVRARDRERLQQAHRGHPGADRRQRAMFARKWPPTSIFANRPGRRNLQAESDPGDRDPQPADLGSPAAARRRPPAFPGALSNQPPAPATAPLVQPPAGRGHCRGGDNRISAATRRSTTRSTRPSATPRARPERCAACRWPWWSITARKPKDQGRRQGPGTAFRKRPEADQRTGARGHGLQQGARRHPERRQCALHAGGKGSRAGRADLASPTLISTVLEGAGRYLLIADRGLLALDPRVKPVLRSFAEAAGRAPDRNEFEAAPLKRPRHPHQHSYEKSWPRRARRQRRIPRPSPP
jgi:hypothetical protein